jgi:hypothetical protein
MVRKDICSTCHHVKASHNVITAADDDDDDPYTHKTSRGVCGEPDCVCKGFKQ